MSLNEILASGGALLLFLTLVQITPIKVNPWSAVGKIIGNGMRAIGKSMNKDVMDKLESVQKLNGIENLNLIIAGDTIRVK